MKKQLSFFLLVLFWISCQQTKHQAPKTDWSVYRKAYTFFSQHNDSAFYYFNQVAANSRDSLQIAMAYNIMAVIQSDAGDHYGAQESLSASLRNLDESSAGNHACLANDYNELGMNSTDLKNYDAAIDFFGQAMKFATDSNFMPVILNNKAFAYQHKMDYPRALKLYQELIGNNLSKKGAAYTRILTNLATTKWLNDPRYSAAPELLLALRIRLREQDFWGQNSSYINLARYYLHSRPDSAFFYASKMYVIARQLNSPDDQMEALETMIQVGPARESRKYFARFRQLDDSLQTTRNAAKNQFALIRYNVEKNKADNLKLQKDNSEKRYQIIEQNLRFYLTLAGFVLLMVIAFRWYSKRKKRMEHEARKAVHESQLKASKKVHDTVANDIYRVMKKIEYDPVLDKDWVLDNIEDVYQRSRDISYEIVEEPAADFHNQLSELLKSFATGETKVVLVGNDEVLWKKINAVHKIEIKCILQELMVNMKKHSHATNVVVKFEDSSGQCSISYFDDGVGFPEKTLYKNGLKNTGNRIKAIQGKIIFDTGSGKGLRIRLSFPTG